MDVLRSATEPIPLYTPYQSLRLLRKIPRKDYYNRVSQMGRHGHLAIVTRQGQKFISLTKKGELRMLLQKARLEHAGKWDGKWRLVIFDIPESARHLRNQLRKLLKQNNFARLQASVFISPYAMNREALNFLALSGLMDFVRILRVDEMDDDAKLRKKFGLTMQNDGR